METARLSKEAFNKASDFLLHSARGLERNIYKHKFDGASCDPILVELQHYQNPDGGFGHGLEPDLRSPRSSPIATTHAFQKLNTLNPGDVPEGFVDSGISYFEKSFNPDSNRWFAASKEINNYPHAPWWHYEEESEKTITGSSWGNPTAEILGYLIQYDQFVDRIDIEELLREALERLRTQVECRSEHEIYCYIRLYKALPDKWSSRFRDQLVRVVQQVVRTDPSDWNDYLPTPLDFIDNPDSFQFGISDQLVTANLNLLIKILEDRGIIEPNWEWGQYEEEWARAKKEWTGILTLRALITLDNFSCLPG